jgi:RNA ligase (TIGR02306 family)
MSTFSVPVVKIKSVMPILDADTIDVAEVLGYRCVVKRGEFMPGQLVAYIPEDSIVPLWIQERLGLVEKLAGSKKDRVKAIKLRGVVSQGVLFPIDNLSIGKFTITVPVDTGAIIHTISEGDDIAAKLGITKYAPPVPVFMAGEVCNQRGNTLKYDIENIQRYPSVLHDSEEVTYTEKIHGTFCGLTYAFNVCNNELYGTNGFAFSKGLGADGLVFKHNEKNANNVYHRMLIKYYESIKAMALMERAPVFVLGEIYGRGIQDLAYGAQEPEFRAFDIYIGRPGYGRYLNYEEFVSKCKGHFESVPSLYRGPYSKETELKFRSGQDAVAGTNLREGIVIKPVVERSDPILGRVILKSVSPEYLLRKGNTTEYQ